MLLFLELNEISFDHLLHYCRKGELPNFDQLIKKHGVAQTVSESRYEELEPWIQWVTAHTGLTLAEHEIFRLGDIVNHDIPQIWEYLEENGLRVGAISPMNAKNRCKKAEFFVPDPWTPAPLEAGPLLRRVYAAIAQAVNDNAQSRITPSSAAWLLAGCASYARPVNYLLYAKMAAAAKERPWLRSMFLDLLLADVFIGSVAKMRPDYASLFLNAGAHIQHHYMFNSAAYQGEFANPDWYISPAHDPVLQVYGLYDRIVGQMRHAFPEARLMLATGLHQEPHSHTTFYWRLKAHEVFLRKVGIAFERVEARMSRDFIVYCGSSEEASAAAAVLEACIADDGQPLFEVNNRGTSLFVMLTYPGDIQKDFVYSVGDRRFRDLKDDVAFVAIKNGKHNGIGYFLDTGMSAEDLPAKFPLKDIPQRVCGALGLEWRHLQGQAAE